MIDLCSVWFSDFTKGVSAKILVRSTIGWSSSPLIGSWNWQGQHIIFSIQLNIQKPFHRAVKRSSLNEGQISSTLIFSRDYVVSIYGSGTPCSATKETHTLLPKKPLQLLHSDGPTSLCVDEGEGNEIPRVRSRLSTREPQWSLHVHIYNQTLIHVCNNMLHT